MRSSMPAKSSSEKRSLLARLRDGSGKVEALTLWILLLLTITILGVAADGALGGLPRAFAFLDPYHSHLTARDPYGLGLDREAAGQSASNVETGL